MVVQLTILALPQEGVWSDIALSELIEFSF